MKHSAYLLLTALLLLHNPGTAQTNGSTGDLAPRIQVSDLLKAFQSARLSKGEEEKTTAHEQRKSTFRYKGLTLDNEMMAVFKPSQFKDDCAFALDADKEEYSFACNFKLGTHNAHGLLIPIQQSAPSDSTYIGANAFNRKVVVKKRVITKYGLLLNPDQGKFFLYGTTLNVSSLKAPSGGLKKDFEQLEVGIVFRAVPPFFDQLVGGTNPTIDSPNDITGISNVVVGIPLKAHLFQRSEKQPFKTLDVFTTSNGGIIYVTFVEPTSLKTD